jgi:hypothetical protein
MPDRNIIADGGSIFLKCAMDTGTVLHIHFVAEFNKVHIAPDNSIEPETAIITGNHITNNGGIRGYETIVTELGKFTFYG